MSHHRFTRLGLMLDFEGGPENDKLWNWYISAGFTAAKPETEGQASGVLYGALRKFIPELAAQAPRA